MYNNYILLGIKIVRKLLNVPIVVVLRCTYIYAKILEIIDIKNSDNFFYASMQKIIDKNIGKKIFISQKKFIRFYSPTKVVGYRIKSFFTKEPETIEWMNSFGGKKKVLYDIGANIGIYSVYYAKKFNSTVYSFEPQFVNLNLIAKNIQINNINKNVIIMPFPVFNKNKISNFFFGEFIGGYAEATFSKINVPQIQKYYYKTIGLSLDQLYELNCIKFPNLIKIDVDGNEEQVIEGLKKIIKKAKKITILIENTYKNSSKKIDSKLKTLKLKKIKQTQVNSIWTKGY